MKNTAQKKFIIGFIVIVIIGFLILASIYIPEKTWKKHTAIITISYIIVFATIPIVIYTLYANLSIHTRHLIVGSWFTFLAIYIILMTLFFELGYFKPSVQSCNPTSTPPCESPGRIECKNDTWSCIPPDDNCPDETQHWMFDPSDGSWTCQSCPQGYEWSFDSNNQIWTCSLIDLNGPKNQ